MPAPAHEVITGQTASSERGTIEIAFAGTRPEWLASEAASPHLERFSIAPAPTPATRVVHLGRLSAPSAVEVRAAHPDVSLVADVGHAASASPGTLEEAVSADLVLVESPLDEELARARVPGLDGKLVVAPSPVDLDANAPEGALAKVPAAYIKRFRRLHRLAPPTVLFVGPYTPSGGLDVAVAAAYRLRDRFEDLRLAAIPLGATDKKFLDQCEMDALGLGHRGIVEWTCPPEDRRFWYATATAVCCPWRAASEPSDAPVLAAAAARPFVGADLSVFRQFTDGLVAELVPPGDVGALVEVLAALLADLERADAIGAAMRVDVEASHSYGACAERLARLWGGLAERKPLDEAA